MITYFLQQSIKTTYKRMTKQGLTWLVPGLMQIPVNLALSGVGFNFIDLYSTVLFLYAYHFIMVAFQGFFRFFFTKTMKLLVCQLRFSTLALELHSKFGVSLLCFVLSGKTTTTHAKKQLSFLESLLWLLNCFWWWACLWIFTSSWVAECQNAFWGKALKGTKWNLLIRERLRIIMNQTKTESVYSPLIIVTQRMRYNLKSCYLMKNNLQDPENKQYFTPNKKMAFGMGIHN